MKYRYRNLKHVTLHGMSPFGEGIFDHPIEGGGIELIEKIDEKFVEKKLKKSKKTKNHLGGD